MEDPNIVAYGKLISVLQAGDFPPYDPQVLYTFLVDDPEEIFGSNYHFLFYYHILLRLKFLPQTHFQFYRPYIDWCLKYFSNRGFLHDYPLTKKVWNRTVLETGIQESIFLRNFELFSRFYESLPKKRSIRGFLGHLEGATWAVITSLASKREESIKIFRLIVETNVLTTYVRNAAYHHLNNHKNNLERLIDVLKHTKRAEDLLEFAQGAREFGCRSRDSSSES